MNPGNTGSFTFFLTLAIEAVAGTVLSYFVWRRHLRGWRALKREQPPEVLARIATNTRVNVYAVWMVRMFQAFSEWGTSMLFIVATLNPRYGVQHPWFMVLTLVWIGFFLRLYSLTWIGLAITDLWLGRRRR